MPVTFAQYLINKNLPKDLHIAAPLDKSALTKLLTKAAKQYPDKYPTIVSGLKHLGNTLATYETQTMGIAEIEVPNKAKRDAILDKYDSLQAKAKNTTERETLLETMQSELAANDLAGGTDSATEMVVSGGLGGKKAQLMKLRTTPGVITDANNKMIPLVVRKSYAEGLNVRDNWLQAIQSRKALQDTQLSTASPGELSKVMSNLLNSAVVSTDDCGTKAGITLFTKDDSVIDRYLAKGVGQYKANSLITSDVQQALLKANKTQIVVRSPETCQAKDGSVCAKCMGLRVSSGEPYRLGDNAGMISAGILGQDVTQLALSSKHGNTMAKGKATELVGEKGFRTYVESPKVYPNRQVLAELYGRVHKITRAPQGGYDVIIQETRKVPERYIVQAKKVPKQQGYFSYYIPPQRELLPNIKVGTEVHPSMELTDGNRNLRDVARLQNLGVARSQATEGMYQIYKRTGVDMDRRHLELLSRNMLNQVKVEKAPKAFPFMRGEIVEYNALQTELGKIASKPTPINEAEGLTLTEGIYEVTAGTELTKAIVDSLKARGIKTVKATGKVQTSAVFNPMTRSLNSAANRWLSKLNHRYIATALKDAAAFGEKENIHSYGPMASYAYGVEFGHGPDGKY
jgi:DNA-directed RNA polymerase subunit beta'